MTGANARKNTGGTDTKEATMYLDTKGTVKARGKAADMLATKGHLVHAIAPGACVFDAVEKMNDAGVGALLVMEGDQLVGIVSERDYARKVILLGRSSKDTPVREIMTAEVRTVTPSTTLAECMQIVNDLAIRHLPVVDDGRVVGVLSIGDLVREVLAQQAETIQSLNAFIGSDYPS